MSFFFSTGIPDYVTLTAGEVGFGISRPPGFLGGGLLAGVEVTISIPVSEGGFTMYSQFINFTSTDNSIINIDTYTQKIVTPYAIVYEYRTFVMHSHYIIIKEANQSSWISNNSKYFAAGREYTVSVTGYVSIGGSFEQYDFPKSKNVVAFSANNPQNVLARGVNGGIYMTWDSPSEGGIAPKRFTVWKREGFFTLVPIAISVTERSYLITGLDNGTPYNVAIFSEADNSGGTYPNPANFITATPQLTPAAPALSGSADNSGQIILSWNTPSVPAELSLSDYVLYVRRNGQDASGSIGLLNAVTFNTPGGFIFFPYEEALSLYLTARGSNGAESAPSNTVSLTPRVVSLSAALAGGQSIASFVATSPQSAAELAVSSIAAVKQTYADNPTQKAAQMAALFAALKAKAQGATSVTVSSMANSGVIDLLTSKPESLPDKPTLIIVDPVVSVDELSEISGSYLYFNLPQRFTKGTDRWIEFAANGTYTTSVDPTTPTPFSMNSLVIAGGFAIQLRALGTALGEVQSVFDASFNPSDTSGTVISYTLAGVDGGSYPTSVSVTAESTYIPVALGWTSGSTTTVSVTAAVVGSKLTMSGLTPNTQYRFTISATGYAPVSIGTAKSVGSVAATRGPPLIQTQPADLTVNMGDSAIFSVSVYLSSEMNTVYAWELNGTGVGTNSASFSTISGANGDKISVTVLNEYGETLSRLATLTVTDEDNPVCFLASAPVLTKRGYRPIATLNVGDEVITADKRVVAICAIKYMTCEPGPRTNPYLIPKGMFGAKQDLMISPRHRVVTGSGEMVEARHLGLKQVEMKKTITYYNLELPNWDTDNMIVAGVHVESLARVEKRTVTMVEFVRLVRKQYGNISATAIQDLLRQHKILPNGTIEVRGTIRSDSGSRA